MWKLITIIDIPVSTGITRQVFDARDGCHRIWNRGWFVAQYCHISTLCVEFNVRDLLVGGPFPSQHAVITAWQLCRKSHTLGNRTRQVKPICCTTTRKRCNLEEVRRRLGIVVIAEIQITIPRVASLTSPSHVEGHAGLKLCFLAIREEIMAAHAGAGISMRVGQWTL